MRQCEEWGNSYLAQVLKLQGENGEKKPTGYLNNHNGKPYKVTSTLTARYIFLYMHLVTSRIQSSFDSRSLQERPTRRLIHLLNYLLRPHSLDS